MSAPRFLSAFAGSLLGVSTQVLMIERLPVVAAAGTALATLALFWAWTRPEPIQQLSDAVLYEAHRLAVGLHDDAGADAIAAELERRREVARG